MVSSDSRRIAHPSFTSANQNATQKRRDFKEMDVSIKALEDNLERLKKLPMRRHQEAQIALDKGRNFGNKFKAVRKSVNDKLGELNLSATDEDSRVEHIKSRLKALAENFNEWFGQAKKAQQGPAGSVAKPRESGGFLPLDNRRISTRSAISGSTDSGSTEYLSLSGTDENLVGKDYTQADETEDDATSKFPVIPKKGNRVDEKIVEKEDGTGDSEMKINKELGLRHTQNFGGEHGTGRVESHCTEEQNRGAQHFGDENGTERVEGHCMEEQNRGVQNFGDEYGTGRVEEQNRRAQNIGDECGTGRVEEQNRRAQNIGDEYGAGRVESRSMEEQSRIAQNSGDEFRTGRFEGQSMEEQNVGLETVLMDENLDAMKEGSSFPYDRNCMQEMNGSVGEGGDVQELRKMLMMGIDQEQGCSASSSGFVNDADCIQKLHDDRNRGHSRVAFEKYRASGSSTEGFDKRDFAISVGEEEDKLHTDDPDVDVVITPPGKGLLKNGKMLPVDTREIFGEPTTQEFVHPPVDAHGKFEERTIQEFVHPLADTHENFEEPTIQEFLHPPVDAHEKFGEPTIQEFAQTASNENLDEEKKHIALEKGFDSNSSANKDMQNNVGISEVQDHVTSAFISTGNEVSENTIDKETCTGSINPKVEVQSHVHEELDKVSAIREPSMDIDLCLAQWRNEMNFDKAESPLWRSPLVVKEEEDELNSLREYCYLHGQNMMFPEKIPSRDELNRTFLDKQSQAQFPEFYAQATGSRFEDKAQEMAALDAAEENILQAAFGSNDESMSEIIMMEEMLNHRRAWENPINNSFKWPAVEGAVKGDLRLSGGVNSVDDGQSKSPKLRKFTDAHPLEEAIKPVTDQQIQVLQEAPDVDKSDLDENGRPPNILAEKNSNGNSSPPTSEEIVQKGGKSSRTNRKTRPLIEIINLGSPISEDEKQTFPFYQDHNIDVVDLVEGAELESLHDYPLSKFTGKAETEQSDESGVEAWHQPAMAKQKLQDTPRQPKLKDGVLEPNAPIQGVPKVYKFKKEIEDENIPENIINSLNSESILSSVKKEVKEKPQYQVTQIRQKSIVKNEFEEIESCSEEDLCGVEESKKYCENNRLITQNLKSIRCEFEDEDHETHSVKSHINTAVPRQSGRTLHIRNCTNWFFPELMPDLESISINTRPCKTKKPLNGRVILQQKNQSSSVIGFEKRETGMEEEQHEASRREIVDNFVESEAEQRPELKRILRKQWVMAVMQSCMLGVAIFSFGFVSHQNFPPPT